MICKARGLITNTRCFAYPPGTELTDRMRKKGIHLDAVKYIYSFKMVETHLFIPLLKAHVAIALERAQEKRKLDGQVY
jgi:hypothetical protein